MLAFNPQPDPPGVWGMFGITPPDTMRINIVNMVFPGTPPDPCNVALRFLNAQGVILKQQNFAVKPAQSAFLDLTGLEAGGGFRTQVHPVLLLAPNSPVGCSAVGSVEVFDSASGRSILAANPIFIPPPCRLQ